MQGINIEQREWRNYMYKITSTRKNNSFLTGFYSNGGFEINDVFAFSKNSWINFQSEKEAQNYILRIKKECLEQTERWGDWVDEALKFWKTLKVYE